MMEDVNIVLIGHRNVIADLILYKEDYFIKIVSGLLGRLTHDE